MQAIKDAREIAPMKEPGLPKYRIVYDELLNRLEAGHHPIGTRLPTEEVLAKTFGVSRVTIRKALDMLVRAGYLIARQGSGYVVATLSPPSSTCMASFTDRVTMEGRIPGARLLRVEHPAREVPGPVATLFDGPLVLVERLRTVDGVPRMITQTWMPLRLAPDVSEADFPETGPGQSILRVLRHRFGLDWTTACETLDSVTADEGLAEQLAIDPGMPILSQACTAFDADGEPVFFDQVYRQGPIKFDLSGGHTRQTGT